MIKSILVCTDGSPYGDTACTYAMDLAKNLKARLLGLHVLDSRMLEGPLMADISGWVGAQPFGAQLQKFRELMEQKGEAILAALRDRCEAAGLDAEVWMKMGHPPRVVLEEEGRADLLVMGRKGEHADFISDMAGSNVERITRHSASPCLITPEKFKPITKILAAYDGSGHAGEALQEAAELAAALDIELLVVTAVEDMDKEKAEQIGKDGLSRAKDHGARASNLVEDGDAEQVILSTARDSECDLIVVGAYGHSRIREMILGSTTTHLVAKAETPVMLVR